MHGMRSTRISSSSSSSSSFFPFLPEYKQPCCFFLHQSCSSQSSSLTFLYDSSLPPSLPHLHGLTRHEEHRKATQMFQGQLARPSSLRGSLKAIEADINHANTLADAIQRAYGGACLQMRVSCSPVAPLFLYLMEWLDCSCSSSYTLPAYLRLFHIHVVYKVYAADGMSTISTYERQASIREFYNVIYPSLQQLESYLTERERGGESMDRGRSKEITSGRKMKLSVSDKEEEEEFHDREDECGICLEVCTKMVLPNCNHAMCINCFRHWSVRSQSCPFCRGNLKRVRSRDLWVLTGNGDVVDNTTLQKENVRRFYSYIHSLPLIIPDTLYLVYYYHCDYVV